MSHGVYCCTACGTQMVPCKCPGPHHRIFTGMCSVCQTKGSKALPKAFQDIERLADYLMVNFQADIERVGEPAVDMAIRLLERMRLARERHKAGLAPMGNSVRGMNAVRPAPGAPLQELT